MDCSHFFYAESFFCVRGTLVIHRECSFSTTRSVQTALSVSFSRSTADSRVYSPFREKESTYSSFHRSAGFSTRQIASHETFCYVPCHRTGNLRTHVRALHMRDTRLDENRSGTTRGMIFRLTNNSWQLLAELQTSLWLGCNCKKKLKIHIILLVDIWYL